MTTFRFECLVLRTNSCNFQGAASERQWFHLALSSFPMFVFFSAKLSRAGVGMSTWC